MLDKIVIVCSGILIGGFVFMYVVGGWYEDCYWVEWEVG